MTEDISVDWFRGRWVTVMGLGLNGGGLGIARWLLRHGARLVVTDLKSRGELKSSVRSLLDDYQQLKARSGGARVYRPRLVLGRHVTEDFTQADLVIRNPAVPDGNSYLSAAQKSGTRIETDMSVFFHLCPVPVVGISGTKGKSTVTALVGEILKRYDPRTVVAGNIRRSPFDDLDSLLASVENKSSKRKSPVPVVLELSSWHLEGLERRRISPHVAVLTNILEDHLNRYRGLSGYVRAKSLIAAFQVSGDFFIYNADDPRTGRLGQGRGTKKMPFSGQRFPFSLKKIRGNGCFVRDGWIVLRQEGEDRTVMPVSGVRLFGGHNLSNTLAACAAAFHCGVPVRTIAAAVKSFRGVPGRLELVARIGGVRYINDTTATMPDASVAAMRASAEARDGGRTVLIAGGADKKLRYGDWGRAARRLVSSVILLSGSATPKLRRALKAAGFRGDIRSAESMGEALTAARELTRPGDTVLLSPACASFGMFVNEFDRGDQFVSGVKKMARRRSSKRKEA